MSAWLAAGVFVTAAARLSRPSAALATVLRRWGEPAGLAEGSAALVMPGRVILLIVA
jgi:hypothetical protein